MATTLEKELQELVLALVLFLAGLGYAVSGLPANIVVGCVIWTLAWILVAHLAFISDFTASCPLDVKIVILAGLTFLICLTLWYPVQKEYAKEHAPPLPPIQPEHHESPAASAPAMPHPRTYLVFDGTPRFEKADSKTMQFSSNQDFEVGNQLFFNFYYRAVGNNQIDLIKIVGRTYLEPDATVATQDRVIADFKEKIKKEKAFTDSITVGQTDRSRFNTAFPTEGNVQPRILAQSDLDAFANGTQIAFVLAEITYKDNNSVHHLRMCELLQPPAIPSRSIWASCRGFSKSD